MLTADVLALIKDRTSARPISLAELCAASNMSERTVKGAIESLRVSGHPIGARRHKPSGYFYILTIEERDQSAGQLIHQAKSELLAACRMVGKQRTLELLGQGGFEWLT